MRLRKVAVIGGIYFLAALMIWIPNRVQAEMLDTQQTLQSRADAEAKRQWLAAVVQRREAAVQLQKFGVSQNEALNRVQSMTDEEVVETVSQIEQYAGAGDPLWKGEGERDWGYFFMIVAVLLVLGCATFCWLIFI